MTIHLYTIGFTKKTAENFFDGLLKANGIQVLVDIRLRRDVQLNRFAIYPDLEYFLKRLINCDYVYRDDMAPTAELLDGYRQDKSWENYVPRFNQLLNERNLIAQLENSALNRAWWTAHRACLLCSEHEPEHCHRSLVAQYMKNHWPEVEIHHLM